MQILLACPVQVVSCWPFAEYVGLRQHATELSRPSYDTVTVQVSQ